MKIYVAGGGGRSVATAAETVGRTIAAKANLAPTVEDVAPASAGDLSGTVEFYAMAVGGAVTGVAATFGRWSGGPASPVEFLFDVHRDRAAGIGRLAATERLPLRWARRADAACDAGDLGRGGVFARKRRHRIANELSCRL
jgi:hypothetical protein